jgi:hypothetical protein
MATSSEWPGQFLEQLYLRPANRKLQDKSQPNLLSAPNPLAPVKLGWRRKTARCRPHPNRADF